MIRLLAVLCVASLLAACGGDGLGQLSEGETGRVAEVRSGDTLVLVNGLVVRLAGIDAPNRDEPYAEQARLELEALVQGQDAQLLYGGLRRDNYGRALAHVRLKPNRLWLQKRLVETGAARVRTYADNRALAAPLLQAEAAARSRAAGLWALPVYKVRLPIETRESAGFQVIEGRVDSTVQTGRGAELNLHGAVRATIAGARMGDFIRAKTAPAELRGQLIRVRGYLRRDGTLALDHPEQIEILRQVP